MCLSSLFRSANQVMKTIVVVLCLCLVHTHLVNSGIILDKITSGFSQARQKVSCGFHKIGSSIISHEHHHTDPCNNKQNKAVETNRIDTDEGKIINLEKIYIYIYPRRNS